MGSRMALVGLVVLVGVLQSRAQATPPASAPALQLRLCYCLAVENVSNEVACFDPFSGGIRNASAPSTSTYTSYYMSRRSGIGFGNCAIGKYSGLTERSAPLTLTFGFSDPKANKRFISGSINPSDSSLLPLVNTTFPNGDPQLTEGHIGLNGKVVCWMVLNPKESISLFMDYKCHGIDPAYITDFNVTSALTKSYYSGQGPEYRFSTLSGSIIYEYDTIGFGEQAETPLFGMSAFETFPPIISQILYLDTFYISPDQRWTAYISISTNATLYRAFRADPTQPFGNWSSAPIPSFNLTAFGAKYSNIEISNSGLTCATAYLWPNGFGTLMDFDCFGAQETPGNTSLHRGYAPWRVKIVMDPNEKFACFAKLTGFDNGVGIECFVLSTRQAFPSTGMMNGTVDTDIAASRFQMKILSDGSLCYVWASNTHFIGMSLKCDRLTENGTYAPSPYSAAEADWNITGITYDHLCVLAKRRWWDWYPSYTRAIGCYNSNGTRVSELWLNSSTVNGLDMAFVYLPPAPPVPTPTPTPIPTPTPVPTPISTPVPDPSPSPNPKSPSPSILPSPIPTPEFIPSLPVSPSDLVIPSPAVIQPIDEPSPPMSVPTPPTTNAPHVASSLGVAFLSALLYF